MSVLTIVLLSLQLVAIVGGWLMVYFTIARRIGQYEQKQVQTEDQLKKQDTKLEKVFDKLVELGQRVYELFGQLKPRG